MEYGYFHAKYNLQLCNFLDLRNIWRNRNFYIKPSFDYIRASCILDEGGKEKYENSWLFETKRCNWKNNVSFYKHNKDNSAWAIKMSKQFQIIYQCDTYIKILRLKTEFQRLFLFLSLFEFLQ